MNDLSDLAFPDAASAPEAQRRLKVDLQGHRPSRKLPAELEDCLVLLSEDETGEPSWDIAFLRAGIWLSATTGRTVHEPLMYWTLPDPEAAARLVRHGTEPEPAACADDASGD